ncbi:hypothetical protein Taro_053646 [Colocasia esculenta]|uniref:Uncharacterized protein n=1 Tax=Colocasia esculenta TaxID=4460 RepID=A0A843XN90_COLES|nr:hypothetical protein [Colocasia esculenta]
MASQPCGVSGVRDGSACGSSTLWRSKVAVLAVRRRSHLVVPWSRQFPVFEVPAALASKGLVIPIGPCSRGSPPLLPSARGSSSRELGVGRVARRRLWRRVVVSSRLLRARFCRAVLPQGLRYAASIGLAGAFWRVFPERCLGGSGGGSSRTSLCCFCRLL